MKAIAYMGNLPTQCDPDVAAVSPDWQRTYRAAAEEAAHAILDAALAAYPAATVDVRWSESVWAPRPGQATAHIMCAALDRPILVDLSPATDAGWRDVYTDRDERMALYRDTDMRRAAGPRNRRED